MHHKERGTTDPNVWSVMVLGLHDNIYHIHLNGSLQKKGCAKGF
jgi:hypothetical protein